MPTVFELITRLMPYGTNPNLDDIRAGRPLTVPPAGETDIRNHWLTLPYWPPDVFAVAGTLLTAAGCYAHPRYFGGLTNPAEQYFLPTRLQAVQNDGKEWANPPPPDKSGTWFRWLYSRSAMAGFWWDLVEKYGTDSVEQRGDACPRWWDAAVYLFVAADEAAAGFGFISPSNPDGVAGLDNFLAAQYARYDEVRYQRDFKRDELQRDFRGYVKAMLDPKEVRVPKFPDPIGPYLPYVPYSQCHAVTAAEACVQPKTQTAQVGCTLHTLSHHIALLPPVTEVRTKWIYALAPDEYAGPDIAPLNVLLVPFPYTLPASSVRPGPDCTPHDKRNPARFFELDQSWLRAADGRPITADELVTQFLLPLVTAAEEKSNQTVHAIVLPELALREELIEPIARALDGRTRVELFLAGATAPGQDGRAARNRLYGVLFDTPEGKGGLTQVSDDYHWCQSKHHRWRLDAGQLTNYGLAEGQGGASDPGGLANGPDWWEHIDIEGRELSFWVFRPGASVAALICEDLARIEPVQRVVRAVGPNLLVALLMDGPQLSARWPGKYAGVLADDPGCSVLTLTCQAMVERSNKYRGGQDNIIALWSEPPRLSTESGSPPLPTRVPNLVGSDGQPRPWHGGSYPIPLETGHHAVMLNLTGRRATVYSADGRDDGNTTVRFHLTEFWQVQLGGGHPEWCCRSSQPGRP